MIRMRGSFIPVCFSFWATVLTLSEPFVLVKPYETTSLFSSRWNIWTTRVTFNCAHVEEFARKITKENFAAETEQRRMDAVSNNMLRKN